MLTDSYLFLNNLRFHYRDWGGEGRPMVLLHGLASNARIWDLVAPTLAQHFRVLALDQRGHGLTDVPDDGYDFPGIVRDLHAFIETLDLQRPLLVGHSWGANTVLQYAVARPATPAGIVLVDGGVNEMSSVPGMTWEKAGALLTPPDLDGLPREDFLERLKGWMGDMYSDENANIVLANFAIGEDDALRRRLPIPLHMRIARAIYEQKPSEFYPRLRCPALLCPAISPPQDERGAQFLALKREGIARAEQANPRVRTIWFDDTVHDVPLHRPAELARAIVDFARSVMIADGNLQSPMISLRPAAAADQPRIVAIIREADINPTDLKWKNFVLAVDEASGEIVGTGQIKTHRDGSRELASIAVVPACQHRGIAHQIVERLLAQNSGMLYLTCRTEMRTLYAPFGFRVSQENEMPPYFRRLKRFVGIFERLLREEKLLVMKREM